MTSIYARYPRNGKTARELAEKLGSSVRTAQRWTSEPRQVYLKRAEERRQRALKLREKGLSIRAIAKELGCSVGTIHRYLKQNQMSRSSTHPQSDSP
ncbi:helix-turn-helix domain-containing protein [Corynebacterium belfantii]|uniref:helix-turn-helix domain-containing protein n=1 Tax=Corynebacterium belfantii TaxID=2014537 RepID=UPI0018CBEE73|nr:helix-turn-helix domain-containing protein [Corynebacterium belfantii]MBG9287806.1 helix-turn-helix domain-containing protein [Corynebacterium belfantii]MBG9333462.1 helix-turn-helix domain-containing protein [Corynebacterium belfantii]